MRKRGLVATTLFVVGLLLARTSAVFAASCNESDFQCRIAELEGLIAQGQRDEAQGQIMVLFSEVSSASLDESERGRFIVRLADLNARLMGTGSPIPDPPLQQAPQSSSPTMTPGLVVVDHDVDPIWTGPPGALPTGEKCSEGEKPVVYRPPTHWVGSDGRPLSPIDALHLQVVLNLKTASAVAPNGWDGVFYYGAIPQLEGVAAVWCGAARKKKAVKGGHAVTSITVIDADAAKKAVEDAARWAYRAANDADRANEAATRAEQARGQPQGNQPSGDLFLKFGQLEAQLNRTERSAHEARHLAREAAKKSGRCGPAGVHCWLWPSLGAVAATVIGGVALSRTHTDRWVSTANLLDNN